MLAPLQALLCGNCVAAHSQLPRKAFKVSTSSSAPHVPQTLNVPGGAHIWMDIKYDIEALIDIDGEDAPPRKRSFVCSFTPVSLVISHICGA